MAKKKVGSGNFTHDVQPCYDRERHTVIKVLKSEDQIKFIPLDIAEGLKVKTISAKEFNSIFKPIPNYPVKKACEMFLGYAINLGATIEVMGILSSLIEVSQDDIKLATGKRESESLVAPPPKEKIVKEKPVKEEKVKTSKAVGSSMAKQKSAAEMFRDLIMEGKLTDEEIFKEVQDSFGIDDSKKTYVNWYRKKLAKDGKNPPAAVIKSDKKGKK